MKEVRNIAILGSTGSIGTQTLDIISEYNKRFRAYLLTANRSVDLLIDQAKKYLPRKVIIADESLYDTLRSELEGYPIEVAAGSKAIAEAVADTEIDIVVTAMVGYSGLEPTISAIKAGKTIALANKETLVVAGELITSLLAQYDAKIIPVDSEHSAIFQCLEGEKTEHAEKIILTASGGPFRTRSLADLEHVTVRDALRHPNWDMGAKVTIDSASMMNKGFEMIEAHWLFGCPAKQIEVVVHPQSIVHSMVAFSDGSIKAQLGGPDMHLP
ncbi:MAG: 1-deoxy-D-xylulose-5-phosphate reductoisomerase, partial [Muribaculaceae bacterium]|nr:1-deoxy-D-xylulose-5-phosphate reductoisomerase [Muribaculaceae bacterium]